MIPDHFPRIARAHNARTRPIDRLIPYGKNSRTHSEAQIAQLAASMKEWGWTNPVLADEAGGVIAGHARILPARQLGIAEVPVMVARGGTDAQKRAYVIARAGGD
jgi:ParB-like chromosome segregation protein Spo0J